MLGAGSYWWLVIPGATVQIVGLLQIFRNGALGGPSIYPECQAARARGQMIFFMGSAVFLVGRLLNR